MLRLFLFSTLIISITGCQKNNDRENQGPSDVHQFHKSIASGGDTYRQQPVYSFYGEDSAIDIMYRSYGADEFSVESWIRFRDGEAVFKKRLVPPESFTGFGIYGVTQDQNKNYSFGGTYWTANSGATMFLSKISASGNLVESKSINYKNGGSFKADRIYGTRDNGYIVTFGTTIARLNEDAEVIWRKTINQLVNPAVGFGNIFSVREDNAGNFILAMNSGEPARKWMIKLDGNGSLIWVRGVEFTSTEIENTYNSRLHYLITDEENNLYDFEVFHYTLRILITKISPDGEVLDIVQFNSEAAGLYDVQYQDGSFFVLSGTQYFNTAQYFEMDKSLKLLKKGVILGNGYQMPEHSGKFFLSAGKKYTDFVIAALDQNDNYNPWQYLRLDNNWTYPCQTFEVPDVAVFRHSDFIVLSREPDEILIDSEDPDNFETIALNLNLEDVPGVLSSSGLCSTQ